MKKSLIFKILYLFLVLIVVAGASVFATNTYLASQVSYGNSNVENALNELFRLKENTYNYSTDEQIIGKWTDGRPIYKKVIYTTLNSQVGNTDISLGVAIKDVININGTVHCAGGYFEQFPNSVAGTNRLIVYDNIFTTPNTIRIVNNSTVWANNPFCIVIEYTKITD